MAAALKMPCMTGVSHPVPHNGHFSRYPTRCVFDPHLDNLRDPLQRNFIHKEELPKRHLELRPDPTARGSILHHRWMDVRTPGGAVLSRSI